MKVRKYCWRLLLILLWFIYWWNLYYLIFYLWFLLTYFLEEDIDILITNYQYFFFSLQKNWLSKLPNSLLFRKMWELPNLRIKMKVNISKFLLLMNHKHKKHQGFVLLLSEIFLLMVMYQINNLIILINLIYFFNSWQHHLKFSQILRIWS